MEREWYLFKYSTHRIAHNKFVQMNSDYYYTYNYKSKKVYFTKYSIQDALNTTSILIENDKFQFLALTRRGMILWFDWADYNYGLNECYEDLNKIRNNLSNIKIGETIIDKVPTFNYFAYYDHTPLFKKRMDSIIKIRDYIQINDPSITITEEDKEYLKHGPNWFTTFTLLYASKERPTIKHIKENYPELLI